MIISLNLGAGKQGNPKIRELLDDKIISKVRPRMHKKKAKTPKENSDKLQCQYEKHDTSLCKLARK